MRPLDLLRPVRVLKGEVDERDPDRTQLDLIRLQVSTGGLRNKIKKRPLGNSGRSRSRLNQAKGVDSNTE